MAGLALALGLGACESAGWPEIGAEPPTPEAAAPVAAPEAEPESAAPHESAPEPPDGAQVAAAPPEPVIDDDPQRLMGLDPAGLGAILGDPQLKRREAPAEIWQYRSESCVFDVFLYDQAGSRRVTYLEARDGDAAKVETRPCLNELLRARLDKPLG